MFKLGEYDEIEAEDIAEYLRDAGIKVDVRTSISASSDSSAFMIGKLSELREKEPDFFEDYEQYLEILNNVLDEGVSQENFIDRFLYMLDPKWDEKRDMLTNLIESGEDLFDDEDDEDLFDDEDDEDLFDDEDDDDLFDDEDDEDLFDDEDDDDLFFGLNAKERAFAKLYEYVKGIGFAHMALDLNEIKLEEGVKKSLGDDPLLQIHIEPEEFDEDNPMMKSMLSIFFDRTYDIYIDEMTAPFIDDVDEMFREDYTAEFINIQALGMVIDNLFEPPEASKKIDFEDFEDLCALEVGKGGHIMRIDATLVAEEISKVLEKNGVIKARGGRIKWKKVK